MTSPHLAHVPNELLSSIAKDLPNSDLKNLRLACRLLRDKVPLRVDRVFISANPLNIKVLRAIADHDQFRSTVTEIVWDDARLVESLGFEWSIDIDHPDMNQPYPEWFGTVCRANVDDIKSRLARREDRDRPDLVALAKQLEAQMPIAESWTYYEELLRQQDQVLQSGADIDALKYALARFPMLRRITITPAAHGFTFLPRYPTPMIRSLPYGFNYPIPRGWPTAADAEPDPEVTRWEDASEEIKNQWRGFRIIMRILADEQTQHSISELILNVHQINTGLNCYIFDKPCQEYNDLVTLISRPGFRRLDLSLLVGEFSGGNWPSLGRGYLRHALSQATGLEHFSLHTNGSRCVSGPDTYEGITADDLIPLRSVFPIDSWPRLRHFGLSAFYVTQDDVISFLSVLPSGIRSVELSFLLFLDAKSSYRDLLYDMRDKLGWRDRPEAERPKPIIKVHRGLSSRAGKAIWVNDEASDFLYGDRKQLFGRDDGSALNQIPRRTGGTEFDEFNPAHAKPN